MWVPVWYETTVTWYLINEQGVHLFEYVENRPARAVMFTNEASAQTYADMLNAQQETENAQE